jgi:predicted lipoprotein with Yx(FWY)xxD motif
MRGRIVRWVLPLALLAVMGVGAAMAATATMHTSHATVKVAKNAKYGMVLVASNGKTLYRFTPDRKGVNTCSSNAACNKAWPRLLVAATAKPAAGAGASASLLGKIKQPKGLWQVTYAGYPLYYYAGDRKGGDANGQGFASKWYVVNARGALVKHAVAASPTPTTTPPAPTTTSAGGGGGDAWG